MTAAIGASDEDEENRAADRESKAALQVVTAAASAMEAFYGQIKPHVALSAEERQARINKRTARWKWVADALFKVASLPSGSRTRSDSTQTPCCRSPAAGGLTTSCPLPRR